MSGPQSPNGRLLKAEGEFDLREIFAFSHLISRIKKAAKKARVDVNFRSCDLYVEVEWNEGTGDFERFRDLLAAEEIGFGYRKET